MRKGVCNGGIGPCNSDGAERQNRDRWSVDFAYRLNGGHLEPLVSVCSPRDVCVRYKTEALTMNGPDEALADSVVTKGLTRRLDPAGDGCLRDGTAPPNLFDVFLLADQRLTVFHEQGQ